jgi:hypothetical protein
VDGRDKLFSIFKQHEQKSNIFDFLPVYNIIIIVVVGIITIIVNNNNNNNIIIIIIIIITISFIEYLGLKTGLKKIRHGFPLLAFYYPSLGPSVALVLNPMVFDFDFVVLF